MHYSEEQIKKAKSVDLSEFLRSRGEQLIKSGREYRWAVHDSLTVRENRWFQHSRGVGGGPIDFVMEFYGLTFPEAMKMLTGEDRRQKAEDAPGKSIPAPLPEFRLPKRNRDEKRVLEYLTNERGLNEDLVLQFIGSGEIYEDERHHNVVFVGKDPNGIPAYAHYRGTGEKKFRGDVTGSVKDYGFCYRGGGEKLYVFEAPIDMLSFIQLFPNDWEKENYLSLGGTSDRALTAFLSASPQITSVFLCLDNDKAGNEACGKLLSTFEGRKRVIRLKPALKDWNEILCERESEKDLSPIIETVILKVPEEEEIVPMICYEDVEQTSVDWLWFPYIPFGKLTIIQGNPGEGKTYLAMKLAAACTNRKYLPNMEEIEPFKVIYQTAEDGAGDTIKPRLKECEADLSKVLIIDETETPLTLTDERIERAIRQNQVKLLIIDPVQAFIGPDVDMNRANEVRPVFRKLGMIADKTGCAIVLIGHLNKASGAQSTYRGLGSIDIMAAVRSLLFIGKVKKDPTTRVLIHEKSSLAPPGETIAFKLGDEGGFRWIGGYDINADDLLNGKEGRKVETKLERGTKLIEGLLVERKVISLKELQEKATELNISPRTMRDVRRRMGDRLEYGKGEGRENTIRLKTQ
ncbi:MAG: AAA family ATPase [Eubacterium sp.]|nr:AAA family ATPase [Eubacterium sp.]